MSKQENKPAGNLPAKHVEAGLPAELMDHMMADAGMGVTQDQSEVGIPFLYILQDLSPQVKKRDEAYVEGAEVGDIYNNVTKEVIPAAVGIEFIVVGFEAAQVEWKPNRGGFAAKHPNNTPLREQVRPMDNGQGKMVPTLPNGNVLTETKYFFGFYRKRGSDAVWEPAVIGMASSMIKNSREWIAIQKRTLLPNKAPAPSFAKVYHIGTSLVSKNNNDWFVWKIEQDRWVTGEEYAAARTFAESVLAGTVKTAAPGEDGGASAGHGDEDETVI